MSRNSNEYTLSTLDTVPASAQKQGTIESASGSRHVLGTNTQFKDDKTIAEGDWIFANGEIRKIERIIDDLTVYIDEPFTAPVLALTDLYMTKASRAREISVINIGGAPTTINGSTFSADVSKTYGETEWYKGSQRDFPDPLVLDGATSNIEVIIIY